MASAASGLYGMQQQAAQQGCGASNCAIWGNWIGGQFGITTSSVTSNIWYVWTQQSSGSANYGTQVSQQAYQESSEQVKKRTEDREAARKRAAELLLAHLDKDQQESLKRERKFIVHSRDRQRVYVVHHGRAGNVQLLNKAGVPIAKYCIHPVMECPDEDTMLAQKLMIETDEESFLRIANKTVLQRAA